MDAPPLPPAVPPNDYSDRRTGLIIFGVGEILLGGIGLLMVPLMFVGQAITAGQAGQEMPWAQTVASMAHIAVLAVALIWLGIGSMMARRWARAILLCVSSVGLVMGIVVLLLLPGEIDGIDHVGRR